MTLEPDQLTRAHSAIDRPTSSATVRLWGVVAAAMVGVAAVIGVSAALASHSTPTDAGAGTAAHGSTTAPSPTDVQPTGSAEQPAGNGFPVSLAAPGWTCDEPADEKFMCVKGGSAVLITVRPASSHDAYLTDPDKASPDQYVSDVHAGVFATLNRMPDDHSTDVFALGAALRWAAQ